MLYRNQDLWKITGEQRGFFLQSAVNETVLTALFCSMFFSAAGLSAYGAVSFFLIFDLVEKCFAFFAERLPARPPWRAAGVFFVQLLVFFYQSVYNKLNFKYSLMAVMKAMTCPFPTEIRWVV